MIELIPVVRRARPIAPGPGLSGLFSTIEQQAQTVVRLATAAEAVLQGRESAHSVRLFDLEQRREELWRRSRAAIDSLADDSRGLEDVRWTMESLDRAAAELFRTATACHAGNCASGVSIGRMLLHIRRESEGLQDGYAGLARGGSCVQCGAGDAEGSRNPLGSYRAMALLELLPAAGAAWPQSPDELAAIYGPHAADGAPWIAQMHEALRDIVRELASAGAILKRISQRLADGLLFQDQRPGEPCFNVPQGSAAI